MVPSELRCRIFAKWRNPTPLLDFNIPMMILRPRRSDRCGKMYKWGGLEVAVVSPARFPPPCHLVSEIPDLGFEVYGGRGTFWRIRRVATCRNGLWRWAAAASPVGCVCSVVFTRKTTVLRAGLAFVRAWAFSYFFFILFWVGPIAVWPN